MIIPVIVTYHTLLGAVLVWCGVLVGCDRTQQNNNILVIITDTCHLTHNTTHQHSTKQRVLNYDDQNNYINMSWQHDKNILVFRPRTICRDV